MLFDIGVPIALFSTADSSTILFKKWLVSASNLLEPNYNCQVWLGPIPNGPILIFGKDVAQTTQ